MLLAYYNIIYKLLSKQFANATNLYVYCQNVGLIINFIGQYYSSVYIIFFFLRHIPRLLPHVGRGLGTRQLLPMLCEITYMCPYVVSLLGIKRIVQLVSLLNFGLKSPK